MYKQYQPTHDQQQLITMSSEATLWCHLWNKLRRTASPNNLYQTP